MTYTVTVQDESGKVLQKVESCKVFIGGALDTKGELHRMTVATASPDEIIGTCATLDKQITKVGMIALHEQQIGSRLMEDDD